MRSAAASLVAILLVAVPAETRADLVITAVESGADVVFTLSGFADVSELGAPGSSAFGPGLVPSFPFIGFGFPSADSYATGSDLAVWGPGGGISPTSTTGDPFQFQGSGADTLVFADGYVSGTPLSATMTFAGSSFASLGLTPGVYATSWGGGDEVGEHLTVTIGTAVPEPSSAALLGLGALAAWRRRRSPSRA